MKLFLNSDRCIACGLCIQEHPEIFELDDAGIAHLKKNLIKSTSLELNLPEIRLLSSTINNCPGRAFEVKKD